MQPRYNLLFRSFERDLLPLCADEKIAVIPYNPLAGGLLTGKHSHAEPPAEGTRFRLGSAAARYQRRYWNVMPNVESVAVARREGIPVSVDTAVIHRTPISAEARGLARDFCRRVGQEASRLNDQAIGAPLRRRIARYPDRRPREDMLRDLARHWRNAQPQQFRLQFHCTRQGKNVFMTERAVTVLNAFRLPHWDANDYGVEVVDTWFEVSRRKVDAGLRSPMWIGSHALARWYQRSGARSDARLLHDIGIGAAINSCDRAGFPNLDDVRVPVDDTAGWRGAMMVAPEADDDDLVFYAKTFV